MVDPSGRTSYPTNAGSEAAADVTAPSDENPRSLASYSDANRPDIPIPALCVIEVDPTGLKTLCGVHKRALRITGTPLRNLLTAWDHLTRAEVFLIGVRENSGWNPKAVNPDGGALGLGQIRPKEREYIARGLNVKNGQPGPIPKVRGRRVDPNTWDPFLQVWMLRKYLRDCGKTAAEAARPGPSGKYEGFGCF